MQLHLGLDHTKFTQDRPPVQSDTVPSCNMAFLTTRTGLLGFFLGGSFYKIELYKFTVITVIINIHPSHFTQCWRFQLLSYYYYYYFYYYYSIRPTFVYYFSPFLSHSFNSNWTVTVSSFIVYTYSIVLIDCIGFDHTLFIISYSGIQLFSCKYVNKTFSSVQFIDRSLLQRFEESRCEIAVELLAAQRPVKCDWMTVTENVTEQLRFD